MTVKKDTNIYTYQVRVRGQIEADFVAFFCPAGTTLAHAGDVTVLANIHIDQSGIVGLLQHLHNLGCTLLLVHYQSDEPATVAAQEVRRRIDGLTDALAPQFYQGGRPGAWRRYPHLFWRRLYRNTRAAPRNP